MRFQFEVEGKTVTITVECEAGGYRVQIGERDCQVRRVQARSGQISFELDGLRVMAHLAADSDRQWVAVDGQTFTLTRPAPPRRGRRLPAAGSHESETLRAEMPGQVRSVRVAEGQAVAPGQTLLVLEAMKMELRVTARHGGSVRRLLAREGQVVERGQVLVELSTT